ncbi:MAG TPA: hydantoinase B/oxoprolinase family protein, partial [Nitrospira sp.]|nr:hydantoinase B/oxoprolinase family protein [Nitrospira sp.]
MNDPYLGGTHLMDVKLVMPFFYEGRLVAWLANTGHWADIGGSVPGGFSGEAEEIFQEGIRIPPIKLVARGELRSDVESLLLANIRVPAERQGDIRAQINALLVGDRQLRKIIEKYGHETFSAFTRELRLRAASHAQSLISTIPDGVYHSTEILDNDGITDQPIKIQLKLVVEDQSILFDFSGSSPPVRGVMNSVYSSTATACFIAIAHVFPTLQVNAGSFDPFRFNIPEETFLNAQFPRAVAGCAAETSQRIIDAVFQALAKAIPERVFAPSFSTVGNLTLGGHDPEGGPYVLYLIAGGGSGACERSDGLTHAPTTIGTARSQPIEILEKKYPIRFTQFAIKEDSAGKGRRRGGFGVIYEFELLRGEAVASCIGDRGIFPPLGLLGGAQGS